MAKKSIASNKSAGKPDEPEGVKRADDLPACFVIMPISDPEGYSGGHFRRVYKDILAKACERAGYRAIRADDVQETNFIQADIIMRIIESPLVLCDLSTRNPNVMYELGIRQAFGLPVVLVREIGTSRIFDIDVFRYTEYNPQMSYRDVISDRRRITEAIKATAESATKDEGINSLIKVGAFKQPAKIADSHPPDKGSVILSLLQAQKNEIRDELLELVKSQFSLGDNSRPSPTAESSAPATPLHFPMQMHSVHRYTPEEEENYKRNIAAQEVSNALYQVNQAIALAAARIGRPELAGKPAYFLRMIGTSSMLYSRLLRWDRETIGFYDRQRFGMDSIIQKQEKSLEYKAIIINEIHDFLTNAHDNKKSKKTRI